MGNMPKQSIIFEIVIFFLFFSGLASAQRNIIFQDNFEELQINEKPDWNTVQGDVKAVDDPVTPGSGKSIKIDSESVLAATLGEKGKITDNITVEFSFRSPDNNERSLNFTLLDIPFAGGKFLNNCGPYLVWGYDSCVSYCIPPSRFIKITAYDAGRWYKIRIPVRVNQQNFDLYIDGKKAAENLPFFQPVREIKSVVFNTKNGGEVGYIDNVSVFHENGTIQSSGGEAEAEKVWEIGISDKSSKEFYPCGPWEGSARSGEKAESREAILNDPSYKQADFSFVFHARNGAAGGDSRGKAYAFPNSITSAGYGYPGSVHSIEINWQEQGEGIRTLQLHTEKYKDWDDFSEDIKICFPDGSARILDIPSSSGNLPAFGDIGWKIPFKCKTGENNLSIRNISPIHSWLYFDCITVLKGEHASSLIKTRISPPPESNLIFLLIPGDKPFMEVTVTSFSFEEKDVILKYTVRDDFNKKVKEESGTIKLAANETALKRISLDGLGIGRYKIDFEMLDKTGQSADSTKDFFWIVP